MNKTLKTLARAAVVAIGLLGASTGAASAADLTLECRMKQTDSNGAQYDFSRRYEITFEVYAANAYDNWGSGWRAAFNSKLIRADNELILLRNDAEVYHEINRRTGVVYRRDFVSGQIVRGVCAKATSSAQLF